MFAAADSTERNQNSSGAASKLRAEQPTTSSPASTNAAQFQRSDQSESQKGAGGKHEQKLSAHEQRKVRRQLERFGITPSSKLASRTTTLEELGLAPGSAMDARQARDSNGNLRKSITTAGAIAALSFVGYLIYMYQQAAVTALVLSVPLLIVMYLKTHEKTKSAAPQESVLLPISTVDKNASDVTLPLNQK